ncbi:hypothetical protein QTP88_023258 [Uroleucon formosanum]
MLGSVVYHMCSDMEQYALERMKYTTSTYNKSGHEATRQSWNTLQSNIECCGIDGLKDWKPVTSSGELPTSCCYGIQIGQSCTEINSYTIGCFEKFKTNLQQNNRIIFWSSIGFALIQYCALRLQRSLISCRSELPKDAIFSQYLNTALKLPLFSIGSSSIDKCPESLCTLNASYWRPHTSILSITALLDSSLLFLKESKIFDFFFKFFVLSPPASLNCDESMGTPKGPTSAKAFDAFETGIEWFEKQAECCPTQLLLLKRLQD